MVHIAPNEPIVIDESIKPFVPLPGSLFQTIQAFVQPANKVFFAMYLKPFWLHHINLLLQIFMEKSYFYIKLF